MAVKLVKPDVAKEFARLPRGEQEVISDAVTAVARALMSRSSQALRQLEARLRETTPVGDDPDAATDEQLDELEARNLLRRIASWRAIEGRSIPGRELSERLGVSRQRIGQLREERRLVALRLPFRRDTLYPTWQFGEDGAPLRDLPRLLEVAREAGVGALDLEALMMGPTADHGNSPADMLREGRVEEVFAIIRAALSHGS